MTTTTQPVKTIVFVTAEGLPDAYVNGDAIELMITQPVSAVEATIIIPLSMAREWAAETYTAITVAHRDHTGQRRPADDIALANVASSGRIILDRLT